MFSRHVRGAAWVDLLKRKWKNFVHGLLSRPYQLHTKTLSVALVRFSVLLQRQRKSTSKPLLWSKHTDVHRGCMAHTVTGHRTICVLKGARARQSVIAAQWKWSCIDCIPAAGAHEQDVYFESAFKLLSWPNGQECVLLKGPAWEERGKANKTDSVQTTKVQ